MNCLPNVYLLLPNWIQSLISSHSDDDSSWDGEDEQGPIDDSSRKTPDTRTPYVQAEATAYEPTIHPICKPDNSLKSKVNVNRGTSQAEYIIWK